jgi:hypothetical protein
MKVSNWMSWEGGVDLVALSNDKMEMPNVIVHVARMVHTPVGSAASGMLLLPNEDGSPKVMGFVSTDKKVGDYFASNVFAGTPFEVAPTIEAQMDFNITKDYVEVSIKIEGFDVHLKLSDLDELKRENRQSPNLPFHDDSLEAAANSVELTVNGIKTPVIVPPMGMSGGPAAVYSATGMYSR